MHTVKQFLNKVKRIKARYKKVKKKTAIYNKFKIFDAMWLRNQENQYSVSFYQQLL